MEIENFYTSKDSIRKVKSQPIEFVIIHVGRACARSACAACLLESGRAGALVGRRDLQTWLLPLLELRSVGGRKRGRGTSMYKRNINRLPPAYLQLGVWPLTQACALTWN